MSDTGDIEIEIEYYRDEWYAMIEKGGEIYRYPVDEVEPLLDSLLPGWQYSVYSQEEEYTEKEKRYEEEEYEEYEEEEEEEEEY